MAAKIICESGATKADWRVLEGSVQTSRTVTAGTNVSAMKPEAVQAVIREAAASLPAGPYEAVHFYTAGVITPATEKELTAFLSHMFGAAKVELQSDLVASARAACGHTPGIAAILGTGSNSCLWDGERIVRHINSGGFILGDEGSASVLGKLFISDYIKGLVPEDVAAEYARKFPSSYSEIIEAVYHSQGSPSGWLGSLCPFILEHYDSSQYIKDLVDGNFRAFARRCLCRYDVSKYPVGIIGGFANALQHIVRPIFESEGIRIRAFIPSPVEGLVAFHR